MAITLRTDVSVRPMTVSTARAIPIHYRKQADDMVEKMVEERIITPVSEPTEWVSPAFFVLKPNKKDLRFVCDFTQLNKAIVRSVHPFPTADDILNDIPNGTKVFGVMDALHG